MAIAFVASNAPGAGTASAITTVGIDSTGSTLLVIALSQDNNQFTFNTPTDSKSNSWTALTTQTVAASVAGMYYAASSPTVGTSHTASIMSSSGYTAMGLLAFSGVASNPLDQENSASGTGPSSLKPGSVTPTEDGELIVVVLNRQGGTNVTIDSGFTIIHSSDFLSPWEGLTIAYKIQTTAAAVDPQWSWTGGTAASSTIATFKAAGGGGGTGNPWHYYAQQRAAIA